MARDLRYLAKRFRKHADAAEHAASKLAVAGTTNAIELLVYVTPVDTSEALSNWQVFLDNPAPDALPPYFPGHHGSTRGLSAEEAIYHAKEELARKTPGRPIFISNLAAHIKKLDTGWSAQFAGGFVPRAIAAFRLAIEREAPFIFK